MKKIIPIVSALVIVLALEETEEQTDQNIPTDVEYKCRVTTISDNRFSPPEDVQFMDMEQLRQGMGG